MNDKQIIDYIKKKNIYVHVSYDYVKHIEDVEQPLINGFNCSGRPNGLYFSKYEWVEFLTSGKASTQYPFCCHIYEINLDINKIKIVKSKKELEEFDKELPDYWTNEIDHHVCGRVDFDPTKYIKYNELHKKYPKLSMTEIYEKERIIITTREEYKNHINSNYKIHKSQLDQIIEQNRNKRWDILAKDYSGIMFCPYLKLPKKQKKHWYETFTTSSGCIWKTDAILSYKLIASRQGKKWKLLNEHTN